MEKPIAFEEALNRAKGDKHLLLGNGFSMGFDKEAFDYRSLKDKVIVNEKTPDVVKKAFERFPHIVDFEHLVKLFSDSKKLIEIYENQQKLIQDLNSGKTTVSQSLVDALAGCHPSNPGNEDRRIKNSGSFIKRFDSIYTLNYDLLLYWARLSDKEKFKDGFGSDWPSVYKTKANVFNLHGALYLYGDEYSSQVTKITFDPYGKGTIPDQVKNSLAKEKYPLVVIGGESKDKENFIVREPYLNWCYENFKSLEGNLFVYGCSFDDKDDHIYLNMSDKVTHLFVGVYDKKPEEKIRKIKEKNAKLEVIYFCSKSANVWGDP